MQCLKNDQMTEHFTAGFLECMLQLIVSSGEWFIRPKGHVSFCLIRKRIAIFFFG